MDKLETAHLRKLLDEFLQWCEIDKGQSDVTVRGKYNKNINLVRWLEETQQDFSIETLKNYKLHMYERRIARDGSEKSRVLNGIRTDLKSNIFPFVSWLYAKGHIRSDWKKEIDLPPVTKQDYATLPWDVIDKVIDAGTEYGPGDSKWSRKRKSEYRDALYFIARTDCRIGAIYNLKQEDVNITTRQYKVITKGKWKWLAFTEDIVPMMEERCKKGEGKVFDLKRANQQQMNEYLHKGAKKLGLPEKYLKKFTVHTIRHSGVTGMMQQGIPLYSIQKAVGHEAYETTVDTYGHLDTHSAKIALDMNPQVQKALDITQRRANIRAIMEMAGLTKLTGTEIRFKDTKKGMYVYFEMIES